MIIVTTILCGVVLAGCSKAPSEKSLTETEGVRDNNQVVSAETPISEVLNEKDRQLWYNLSSTNGTPGKDSHPSIFVFQNGNAQIYDNNGLTMGDITKMSDDEIVKVIKEPEKNKLSDSIDTRIEELERDKERNQSNSTQIDAAIAALEKARNTSLKVEPQPYSLNIETDSTGNNTEEESLTFDTYFISLPYFSTNEMDDEYFSDKVELKKNETEKLYFSGGYAKFEVYDQWFTGVYLKGLGRDGNYFVMRDPGKTGELSFVLDQPGAKGVTVDE